MLKFLFDLIEKMPQNINAGTLKYKKKLV